MFDPDIEWLRLISPELAIAVAVLEEQHVRRAAERLGVPQPTVSAVMHRLADAIGAPLVQARGRCAQGSGNRHRAGGLGNDVVTAGEQAYRCGDLFE